MIGLLLFRSWVLRTLCVVYPVLTVIVIVSTANHYLLDAVAGAAVALLAAAAAGLIPPRLGASWRTGARSLRRVLRRRVGQQSGY